MAVNEGSSESLRTEFSTPDHLNRDTQNGVPAAQHRAEPPFSLLNIKNEAELNCLREEASCVCHVKPEDIQDIYPCTVVQESLVALSVKNPHICPARYFYRLPQDISLDRFHAAFQTAVEAHSILRTRVMQTVSGEALQVVIRQGINCPRSEDLKDYLDHDFQQATQFGAPLARASIARHEDNYYYFIFTLHQAAYDDWALALFMKHIEDAYNNRNLPTQAFSRFTRYCLESHSETAEKFWQSELTGKKTTPAAFPALPSDTYLASATRSLVQITNFEVPVGFDCASTIIELAWAILMAQHTDSDDVVFGVADTGKRAPMPGIESMSGVTLAIFPLRVQVPRRQNIHEARKALHAQRARIVPFEQLGLHNISRLSADAAVACRFQSLLVLQPPRRNDYDLFREVTNDFDLESHATFGTYPITLVVEPGPISVSVQAVYDDNIVPQVQMQRILHQHAHLVKWINQNAHVRIEDIPVLCPEDREQLQLWNGQSTARATSCVHDLISQRCASQPEAPAVCAWDGEFTYGELDDLSTACAAHLQQTMQVAPDVIVPLYFEKSRWTAVAILAVMKAGGAFVLLDPSTPVNRLQVICQDTKAPFVVAPSALAGRAAELMGKVIVLDNKVVTTDSANCDFSSAKSDNVLYVVFTSGSTGKPKGVVIEHGAFCASALAYIHTAGMSPSTRALQFASYAFDVSVTDHLATLLAGGCICIPSPEDRMNQIADVVSKFQINYADFTPSFLRSLSPGDVPTLETVISGGEALSRTDIKTWCPHVRLLNIYGPAECCVLSTVQPDVATQKDPLNIGFATGGVCWIADKSDYTKLLPIGAVGELLVGGPIVGRGYLNDPDKTAAAFVRKPCWLGETTASSRLYKTGDLVQYASDGSIRFLGRKDMQVKLRGQRVELGEVEYYLRQCFPSALEVVAEVVKARVQNTVILAAFILNTQSPSSEEDFMMLPDECFQAEQSQAESRLRDQLPNYMIPSVFIRLTRLPLTATGKTDRKLLRERLSSLSPAEFEKYTSVETEKRAPATDQERLIHQSVTRLLELSPESVGMEDSLFRIGGDSITVMKLSAVTRKQGWILTVPEIFSNLKLVDMALVIRRQTEASLLAPGNTSFSMFPGTPAEMAPKLGVLKADIIDILPATEQQHSMLSFPPVYELIHIPGPLDVTRLESSCKSLIQRHSILRTVFVNHGNSLFQVILRSATTTFEHHECSGDLTAFQTCLLKKDSSQPLPLEIPSTRFFLLSHGDKEHVLIVRLTHAVYDGESEPIILQDIANLYNGHPLPPPIPFAPWAYTFLGSATTESYEFWRILLKGSSMTYVGNPFADLKEGEEVYVDATRSFPTLEPPEGTTLASLVKAAWLLTLAKQCQKTDVVFGQIVHGRAHGFPGEEAVVGPCLNLIPVRANLTKIKHGGNLLHHVQQQNLASTVYDRVQFQDIINNSTDWPEDTTFGTKLLHRDVGSPMKLQFGGTLASLDEYYAAELTKERRELVVLSTVAGQNHTVQILATNAYLDEPSANAMVDTLVSYVQKLAQDPQAIPGARGT